MYRKHEARLPEKNLIWELFPVCEKPVTAGPAGYFPVLFSGLAEAFSGEPETRGPFTGKNLIWKLFPVCANPVTAGLSGFFPVFSSHSRD